MNRESRTVTLVVSIASATTTTLPAFLTGALAVVIRHHLDLTTTQLGLLVSTFFAAAIPFSLLIGPRVKLLGVERLMRIAVASTVLSLLTIALLDSTFLSILVSLILAGAANGVMQPTVNQFLVGRIKLKGQGLAFGIKQAAVPLATLLAGLAVPLVALTIGWRYGYLGAAIFGIVTFVAIPTTNKGSTEQGDRTATKVVLGPLIILAMGMAFGAGAANAMGAFLVSSNVHSGFSPGTAGYLAAIGSASSFITRIMSGFFADRRRGNHLTVVAAMLMIGAVGYLLLSLCNPELVVFAGVLAYAAGWGWNGVFNFAITKTHPGSIAHATGITQAGLYCGSLLGPSLFGVLVDHYSFAVAWQVNAVFAVIGAIAMWIGRRALRAELAGRDLGA
ncbi:MFS transporter [Ferrimicrobium acidiphilum]|uniref:MFS transporter n=1 Tax=Ferrimicrobium acidiphilum TaxID=121039 RepID=UPI0023F0D2B7|nr:MFS transporter [Ferrimicrobium acidiphilum]